MSDCHQIGGYLIQNMIDVTSTSRRSIGCAENCYGGSVNPRQYNRYETLAERAEIVEALEFMTRTGRIGSRRAPSSGVSGIDGDPDHVFGCICQNRSGALHIIPNNQYSANV